MKPGSFNRKEHWENIYQTKVLNEVSWYQPKPETSLELIQFFDLPKTSKIIDVGGGDSFLVDNLLSMGFSGISVLDISQTAINRAKKRLGNHVSKVNWIVEDITKFQSFEKYDLWHDRAAFHFLTNEQEILKYIETVKISLNPNGVLIIGTFSVDGPKKCSGIDIKQYSEQSLTAILENNFKKVKCITINHQTPFNTIQNFVFCCFKNTL